MLRLGYSLVKNKLLHLFGRIPLPSILIYFITYRCNLNCRMCSAVTYHSEAELNTRQIKNLFDQLKSLQLVRITGGEPFVREDLPEIVGHIQKRIKPHMVHITTNGTLTERIIALVKDRRNARLFLAVSLDSLEDAHDSIRGKGAFNKTVRTLEELVRIRDQYKFQVEVNQTILDTNIEEVDKFADFMAERGLKINYQLARDFHPPIPKPTEPDAIDCPIYPPLYKDLEKEKLDRLLTKILKSRQNFDTFYEKLVRRYYITGVRNRLVLGTKYPNPRCSSLYEHMRLAPDGNILICRSDLTVVGNAAENGFRNVWFGERATQLRGVVDNCKGCWHACESVPSGIYTWDVFAFKMREFTGKTPET